MAYNQYDLNTTSLVKTGILTEMYIPLWWYSSGYASTTTGNWGTIQKGSTSVLVGTSAAVNQSNTKIHTLSSSWSPNQKFAFEASLYVTSASYTANAELWDFTTNTSLSSSRVSTTANTFTLLRSGQFTLTPGHVYGIVMWTSDASGATTAYLTKASLIAFLN